MKLLSLPLSHHRVRQIQTSCEWRSKDQTTKKAKQELHPPRCLRFCCLRARSCVFPCFHPADSSSLRCAFFFWKGPPRDPRTGCRTTAFVQKKNQKDINSLKLLVSVHWAGTNHNSSVSIDPVLFYYRQYHFLLHGPAEGGEKQTRPRSIFICPWFYGSGCVQ